MPGCDRASIPGLCGDCLHAREVRSGRGSVFCLCGRAATDPAYGKYPYLPVLDCPGFESRDGLRERNHG